jgi:Ser/Thr protein kinase RdoA (MazF antagonist)
MPVCEAAHVDLVWRITALAGATSVVELSGGHQSRVFVADRPDGRVVVKVRRQADVDRAAVTARMAVVADLAAVDPQVCGPVPLGGVLVTELEDDGDAYVVTCCEHVDGPAPDPANPVDAALMGRALARLHRSMASLDPQPLPLVAALRTVRPDWDGPSQLLHGDFNAGNLRVVAGGCRIFDFDDCGYGPPVFDVANALLMVEFDDVTGGRSGAYASFEESFLAGYQGAAFAVVDTDELHAFVDLRVDALEHWLDHPDTAPAGIRHSSPAWHSTLRGFVSDHRRWRHADG